MSTKTFKLLVQVSECCLDILRYFEANIIQINQLGIRIHVEKINKKDLDEELVHKLNSKGITRLPALITDSGKVYIGIGKIRNAFETEFNSARKSEIGEPSYGAASGAEMGSNPELQDFYTRELYEGFKDGKFIPRKDDEKNDSDRNDIEDRMKRYNQNVPTHRRSQESSEEFNNQTPRQRQRNHDYDNDSSYDNIADESEVKSPDAPRRGANDSIRKSFQPTDDALDDKMMAAWIDKNGDEGL